MLGSPQTAANPKAHRRPRRVARPVRLALFAATPIVLVLLAAWIDGGEEPLRAMETQVAASIADTPR